MSIDPNKLDEIFCGTLALGSPDERERFLTSACKGDAELRQEVDSLLQYHLHGGNYLRQTVVAREVQLPTEAPGTIVGRYKLLQQIGEGGFGVVFMAQQEEPVRRLVALKILKPGMDTKEVIGRFEAERQALALMDHPNIARVLDGGATVGGRPYFVMDLVKGIPITEFCEQRRLSTEARLKLFLKICSAVQHAHQKGIIHRDLKPTNVLVTLHDGKPVTKVIDFGIAKAIGQKLTERTLFTRFEQLIGTPAYMSPEQAEWSGLDIDTRSDIYSLGALLYELLTGTTPLEKETLARAALDQVRQMIREAEVPKPSTRLAALVAADRMARESYAQSDNSGHGEVSIDSRRRHRLRERLEAVRGDLDWILLKALEKDRSRRYETVNALARDIEWHLNGEPVAACPPSAAYRARKFVRRHRLGASIGTAMVFSVVLGVLLMLTGFMQARRQSRRAEEQAAIANAVNDFLTSDLVSQANLYGSGNRNVTVREAFEGASTMLRDRFTNQPLVEAAIQFTVGSAFYSLGDMEKARSHLRRSFEMRSRTLGPDHQDTIEARDLLAIALYNCADSREEGEKMLDEAVEAYRPASATDNDVAFMRRNVLAGMCKDLGHGDKAEQILRDLLGAEKRHHGPEHGPTRATMIALADICLESGRYSEAVELNEELLGFDRQHPGRILEARQFGAAEGYLGLGEYEKAVAVQEEALGFARQTSLSGSPALLDSVGSMARVYAAMGEWKRAIALFEEATPAPHTTLDCTVPGAVAALVGRDTNAYREFISKILRGSAGMTNEYIAGVITIIGLLRPDALSDLKPVFERADALAPRDPGFLDGHKIAQGMSAYRRGNFGEALTCFEAWDGRAERGTTDTAEGGCLRAMVHYRLGDTNAAQAELREASRLLDFVACSGELGYTWNLYGQAVIIRAEAERLILGREVSSIPDAAALKAARARWAPVRNHLNEGDRLALEKKWSDARNEYLAAIQEPVFNWRAAEGSNPVDNSSLASRMGITFLLANDLTSHRRICQQMLALLQEHPDHQYASHVLRLCLARELDPTDELTRQAQKWAAFLEQDSRGVTGPPVSLVRRMTAFRSGRYQQALDTPKIGGRLSVRNAEQIVRAMAFAKLGRWEEGRKDLREAETNLAKPLKNLSGDLWWDLAMCQVLLDEAHRVFASPTQK